MAAILSLDGSIGESKDSESILIISHKKHKVQVKAAAYTGFAYLITVFLLYLHCLILLDQAYGLHLLHARHRYHDHCNKQFSEMKLISLLVAGVFFVIDLVVKQIPGIDI